MLYESVLQHLKDERYSSTYSSDQNIILQEKHKSIHVLPFHDEKRMHPGSH